MNVYGPKYSILLTENHFGVLEKYRKSKKKIKVKGWISPYPCPTHLNLVYVVLLKE